MIGRSELVSPLDLPKWAREMAAPQAERRPFKLKDGRTYDPRLDERAREGLRMVDARILGLLAGYADKHACCHPGIKLLAQRTGLKVHVKTGRDGQPKGYTCSAVSASLQRLLEEGLVFWKGAGRGKTVTRELMFNPSAYTEGSGRRTPSSQTEGSGVHPSVHTEPIALNPSVHTEGDPSSHTEEKGQEEGANAPEGAKKRRGQEMPSADAAGHDLPRDLFEKDIAAHAAALLPMAPEVIRVQAVTSALDWLRTRNSGPVTDDAVLAYIAKHAPQLVAAGMRHRTALDVRRESVGEPDLKGRAA